MKHSFPTRRSSDLLVDSCNERQTVGRDGDTAGHPPILGSRATIHSLDARQSARIGLRPDFRASWRSLRRPGARHRSAGARVRDRIRSEEHTSELQSLMRISYAVFCLKKKKNKNKNYNT